MLIKISGSKRVESGGSWYYGAGSGRVAGYYDYSPGGRGFDNGFRISRRCIC